MALGSLAHTEMLEAVDLLSKEDFILIQKGLQQILSEIREGSFTIDKDVEDVHSQVEGLLTQRIGEAGKKIHSGRSRSDQGNGRYQAVFRGFRVLALKEEVKLLFDLIDLP